MKVDSMRKEWIKPELVVLTRHKPEETVLTACKGFDGYGGVGVNAFAGGCDMNYYAACDVCETMVANS